MLELRYDLYPSRPALGGGLTVYQPSLKCGAFALRYSLLWAGRARTQPVRGCRDQGA